ncbi:MAG: DUF1080 domain-containing protein [Bacteroidetes bacterium]|nr:DUF1080 domain-containing protein [Bacteroidota bacterium]
MKKVFITFVICLVYHNLSYAQSQSDAEKEAAKTEVWFPVPPVVKPAREIGQAPSDAIVLFDGKNVDAWQLENGQAAQCAVKDGIMTIVKNSGSIQTRQKFNNFQLHLEWKEPLPVVGDGQGRGNSGVYLQEEYEIQVLDSYENPTYSNGQCGALYKQSIPLVNACRQPGEWQSYDIIWTAPIFNTDKTLKTPAFVTVFQNGILIQNHVEVKGKTLWSGEPYYEAHGPKSILLQDHGDNGEPVSFRNIWIRNL